MVGAVAVAFAFAFAFAVAVAVAVAVAFAAAVAVAVAGRYVLGHVNRPDARPAAQVEDAGGPMLRDRGLVQVSSPGDEEQLVVDVHAVLFGLVTRVHVEAAPESMVQPAVLFVRLRGRNYQPAVLGQRAFDPARRSVRPAGGRPVAPSGDAQHTHPFEAIVTIGAALLRIQAAWRSRAGAAAGKSSSDAREWLAAGPWTPARG